MRPDVLGSSIDHALSLNLNAEIYYPSPRGRVFTQSFAKEMLKNKNLIFLCGRYEGIDERVIESIMLKKLV